MFQPRMANVCAVSGSRVRPGTPPKLRGSGSATQRSLSEATKQREGPQVPTRCVFGGPGGFSGLDGLYFRAAVSLLPLLLLPANRRARHDPKTGKLALGAIGAIINPLTRPIRVGARYSALPIQRIRTQRTVSHGSSRQRGSWRPAGRGFPDRAPPRTQSLRFAYRRGGLNQGG